MTNAVSIVSFFSGSDSREHTDLLKRSIRELISNSYHNGYMRAIRDVKKRRAIENQRRSDFINGFLDYIFEMQKK